MLTDSERFAFLPRRLHGFVTTGNAYDACQTDDRIAKGDTLIVLPEGVVGIAWAWPVAVTAHHGHLHGVADQPGDSIEELAAAITMTTDDIACAVAFARALGLAIDPAFDRVCPAG